jgi:uncharacterized protein YuzE
MTNKNQMKFIKLNEDIFLKIVYDGCVKDFTIFSAKKVTYHVSKVSQDL